MAALLDPSRMAIARTMKAEPPSKIKTPAKRAKIGRPLAAAGSG